VASSWFSLYSKIIEKSIKILWVLAEIKSAIGINSTTKYTQQIRKYFKIWGVRITVAKKKQHICDVFTERVPVNEGKVSGQ